MTGARRRTAAPGTLACLATALAPLAACDPGPAAETPDAAPVAAEERERAWSVALHVHGSFSEGVGSLDSHGFEARALGVDVIWWSDHDFRIAAERLVSRFGFEDWQEPIDHGESWQFRADRERGPAGSKRLVAPELRDASSWAAFVDEDPREGRRSLLVSGASRGDAFEPFAAELASRRALHRRSLAIGLRLELSTFVEEGGADARAFVEVGLSEHPDPATGELVRQQLRYVCGEGAARRDGATVEIPLRCERGRWTDHVLALTADAARAFGDDLGRDNALESVHMGVETRRSARATVRFDRLRIEQEGTGDRNFALQRDLIDAVSRSHPGVRQLQGVEISYSGRHLNEFSVDTRLTDYAALVREADAGGLPPGEDDPAGFGRFATVRTVDGVHARGGLVSLNHPFGTGYAEAGAPRRRAVVLENLTERRAFGADLLEVGYRDRGGNSLDDHLWLWDRLAERGVRLVGIGVSDSHGGPDERWDTAPNNFVSWIHAASPEKADLIEGLRAGRVFFGDPVLFDGTLDLSTPGGARMGDTVAAPAPDSDAPVSIEIEGLVAGDRIVVVEASGETARHEATGSRLRIEHLATPSRTEPGLVRVGVYTADGRAKVFSNPIYFVPRGDGG